MEDLVAIFVPAFLRAPGETLCRCVELAVAADLEGRRLVVVDSVRSQGCTALGGAAQLVVCGCLHMLGQDVAQLDSLLRSSLGSLAVRLAVQGKCLTILALPQLQHHLGRRWCEADPAGTHGDHEHDDTPRTSSRSENSPSPSRQTTSRAPANQRPQTVSAARNGGGPPDGSVQVRRVRLAGGKDRRGSCTPAPSPSREGRPWLFVRRGSSRNRASSADNTPNGSRRQTSHRNVGTFYLEVEDGVVVLIRRLLVQTLLLPITAACPPLAAPGGWLGCPPQVKYVLFEASSLALTLTLTFCTFSMQRGISFPIRDALLLVWAVASFTSLLQHTAANGLRQFAADRFALWLELPSQLFTVVCMALNLLVQVPSRADRRS